MASDLLTVSLKGAEEMIMDVIKYNIYLATLAKSGWRESVILQLFGNPGIGKTAVTRSAAEKARVDFSTFCLTQYDPILLGGMKFFDKETRQMYTNKPEWIRTEGKHCILVDEFAQGTLMAKNIMGEPLNEGRIGPYELSPELTMVLASNPANSKAGTTPTPSQIRDRTTDLYIEPDFDEFAEMALENGVNPIVISFLRYRKKWFNSFDASLDKNPTQRSWTKVSEILKMNMSQYNEWMAIQGQVGSGPFADFKGYLQVYKGLPSLESIVKDPDNAAVPNAEENPSLLYAMTSMLSDGMTRKNAGAIVQFGKRLPEEFMMMMMKDALTRDRKLSACGDVSMWLATDGRELVA